MFLMGNVLPNGFRSFSVGAIVVGVGSTTTIEITSLTHIIRITSITISIISIAYS